jgi:tryptophanyl-tRNA synthetase
MSLQDPKKKMSKSDGPESYISLFHEPEVIKQKILRAVTDTGKVIKYDTEKKPGISNLLTIYSLLSDKPIKDIEKKFKDKGYADFKKSLADVVVNYLDPIRKKRKELLSRKVYVEEILKQGQRKAQTIAQSTMQDVREKMGLTLT